VALSKLQGEVCVWQAEAEAEAEAERADVDLYRIETTKPFITLQLLHSHEPTMFSF
jgi:hypothetical protein